MLMFTLVTHFMKYFRVLFFRVKIVRDTIHTLYVLVWAGYLQAVDCLKSFVIATTVIDRELSVEQAVDLARLEQEFQV